MRSTIRLRSALLSIGVVAVSALGVTPAMAEPHPGIPHGDAKVENWKAVALAKIGPGPSPELCYYKAACPIESGVQSMDAYVFGLWIDHCTSSLSGRAGPTGYIEIEDFDISAGCGFQVAEKPEFPWEGVICKHTPTGEYWLRQVTDLVYPNNKSLSAGEDVTFGQVGGSARQDYEGQPVISPTGVRFGDHIFSQFTSLGWNPTPGSYSPAKWGAAYRLFDHEKLMMAGEPETPCDWPDLGF